MTRRPSPFHYSMVIRWDPRDAIFVADVPELPGCMTHGATYEEAVAQGQDAIESWLDGVESPPMPRYFVDEDVAIPDEVTLTA